jgi:hypothetical protein
MFDCRHDAQAAHYHCGLRPKDRCHSLVPQQPHASQHCAVGKIEAKQNSGAPQDCSYESQAPLSHTNTHSSSCETSRLGSFSTVQHPHLLCVAVMSSM